MTLYGKFTDPLSGNLLASYYATVIGLKSGNKFVNKTYMAPAFMELWFKMQGFEVIDDKFIFSMSFFHPFFSAKMENMLISFRIVNTEDPSP